MKRILHSFIFFLLTIPLFAQWVQQNSGTTADLYDVFAITENTVVVVGTNGTILKTTDGGVNWLPKTSGTTYDLRKVAFANSTTGYAVGFHGTLLKTTDAGETWTALNAGTTEDLYGLSVINENLFFLSGTNGLLKKTLNAGTTWTTIATPLSQIVEDIQFFNENQGYVLIGQDPYFKYGTLFKTSNSGTNWFGITNGGTFSFFFLDFNLGFFSVDGQLYKTINSGNNITFLGYICPAHPSDIYATNENIIWSITIDAISYPLFATSRAEINANQEFQQICNTISQLLSIYFYNETTGYTVGGGGAIYKNSTGILLRTNDTHAFKNLEIFPNPATDKINISLQNNVYQPFTIKLVNVFGQDVFNAAYNNQTEITIDVENFAKGIYFLQISDGQNSYAQKIAIY